MDYSYQQTQSKRLFEAVLGEGIDLEVKKQAILSIIKIAIIDHSHFSFLLNQVNWFCESNLSLIPLLAKVLRAYRGTSKTAPKVVFNLLAEGLSIPKINVSVVNLFGLILQNKQDNIAMFEAIRQNYPHKVCSAETHIAYVQSLLELIQRTPAHRFDILELIVQNLTSFDTEMSLGQIESFKISCPDEEVLELEEECGIFELKYDEILSRVLQFVSGFDEQGKETLLKEMFLIFEKIIMTVDNTKMIQSLVFYLAQTSTQNSSSFLTLLLVTIIENYTNKTSKRKFVAALQYLRCYLNKSLAVSKKTVKKVFSSLVSQLEFHLQNLSQAQFSTVNLNQLGEQNFFNLYILETILYIKWKFPMMISNESSLKSFNELIKQANTKLHFTVFIDPVLIDALEFSEEKLSKTGDKITKQNFKTKCIQKFLPIFLPKTKGFIKMKETLSIKRRRPNWGMDESTEMIGNACKKLISSNGSITPISIEGIEV